MLIKPFGCASGLYELKSFQRSRSKPAANRLQTIQICNSADGVLTIAPPLIGSVPTEAEEFDEAYPASQPRGSCKAAPATLEDYYNPELKVGLVPQVLFVTSPSQK